ncbi:MAG: TolC family protein [Chitinophagia bacterium]|jgi:outer membrane protein
MTSRVFLGALFSLFSLSSVGQGDKWDLLRCVEHGMKSNISVRQAEIQAQQSEISFRQANLQKLPSLQYSLTHGFSFGRTLDRTTNVFTSRSAMFEQMSIQSNVLLYNFNARKNNEASSKFTLEADKASVDKARNDIGLNIAQLYLRALLSNEQAEISKLVLDQTISQYRNTRKLVDAGSLPELNAAELEATVARDSATYVQALAQVALDKLSLKSILMLPADQSFDIVIPNVDKIPVDNILEIRPDVIYETALNSQPQIKGNDLRRQAAEKALKVSEAQMKPSLSAFGQLATNFNQFLKKSTGVSYLGEQSTGAYIKQGTTQVPVFAPNYGVNFASRSLGEYFEGYGQQLRTQFGQGLGVSFNVPIFNGHQARGNMERSRLNLKQTELAVERDKLQLKQDIYTAYYGATGAYQTYVARIKALETAERSFQLANRRYELGVMQTIEWLNNQNNLTRARIDKVVSQYDFVFRMKVLEFYKGQGLRL